MSRPLNILWITDHCCYDGILHAGGRLFLNVIPRFNPDRVRVVPCMIRSSDEVREIFEQSPLDVNIFDRGRFDLRTIWQMYKLIGDEKLDVMHLHCYGTSTYGRLAALLRGGVPCILHDYDTDYYFPYSWYLALADRMLAPFTAGAIASNPGVADFSVERRHIPRERVKLFFHPILPERFEPVPEAQSRQVREKLSIPEGAPVAGVFSKLAPERGNEFLLEAVKEVVEAVPEAVFLFVYSPTEFHRLPRGYSDQTHLIGRDKNREALEKLAAELGIERNVRFFETVDVPNEVEAACDLQVAPWLSERFSVARVLDAMPKGLPLVGTKIGELPHVMDAGKSGHLVGANDVKGLAEALVGVMGNRDHLARLQQGARQKAQEFHIDTYVRRLEDWYTELAARG